VCEARTLCSVQPAPFSYPEAIVFHVCDHVMEGHVVPHKQESSRACMMQFAYRSDLRKDNAIGWTEDHHPGDQEKDRGAL